LKKKSKGIGFKATGTPQRESSGAPAVTPTSPPKFQHRSQAGNDVWADYVSTLISVADSLSVIDKGGIRGIAVATHNNNIKEKEMDNSTGAFSDSGHNNSKEKKQDGNNNNARSNNDKGGIGGIAVAGHNNNNSKDETVDTMGAISDLGHNTSKKKKKDKTTATRGATTT